MKNVECTNFLKQLPEGTTACDNLKAEAVPAPAVVASLTVPDITSGFGPYPDNLVLKVIHGVEK